MPTRVTFCRLCSVHHFRVFVFSPVLCEIEDISSQTKSHAGFWVFGIISYSVGSCVYVNNIVLLPPI